MSAVDTVAWAPLVEEIGFRGVLYVTLRTRLRPPAAIALTALLFAAVHPYSLAGFVIIFVAATVWAWTYEKTGSLLPGIIAHFLGNLAVTVGLMLVYR